MVQTRPRNGGSGFGLRLKRCVAAKAHTPFAEAVVRTGMTRGRAVRVALNQTMSAEDVALSEGCEVAFFPPVTGG